MRHLILLLILLCTACTPQQSEPPVHNQLSAPLLLSPAPNVEFITSDQTMTWEWPELQAEQVFVLRVWFGEDSAAAQEIWLAEKQHNIQDMVDAYSRDVGAYYWQVAVVNRNAEGGFDSMGSDWSEIRTMQRVRRLTLEPYPLEAQSDMARYFSQQDFATQFDLINALRDFIHENTDATQQLSYEADYSDAMQMLFNHSQGISAAPQLYCDGMSTGMLTILRELGIESRIIYLYGEGNGWINQHTTLEVFNTETQHWEVHDTTFNRYFIDTETGERASIERLVFGNIESITGCTTAGTCDPQALTDSIGIYLGALRYGYTPEVWVNPNRLNISRRVDAHDNHNFPEFIANLSGFQQRDLIFHFDTWETLPENPGS